MDKKASTQAIVGIIIAILSIIIILLFLSLYDFKRQFSDNLCRTTILLRGKLPDNLKPSIPNMCVTQKICYTRDGTCEKMGNQGIKRRVKSVGELYSYLGEEMAICWWKLGEGTINYPKQSMVKSELFCDICNEINFDDSLNSLFSGEEKPFINRIEFYKYLEKKNYSKTQSYADYLSLAKTEDLEAMVKESIKVNEHDVGFTEDMVIPKIKLDTTYFIVTGQYSNINQGAWEGAIATGSFVGVSLLLKGSGAVGVWIARAGATYLGTLIGDGISIAIEALQDKPQEQLGLILRVVQGESGEVYIPPAIVEANSANLRSLRCNYISSFS